MGLRFLRVPLFLLALLVFYNLLYWLLAMDCLQSRNIKRRAIRKCKALPSPTLNRNLPRRTCPKRSIPTSLIKKRSGSRPSSRSKRLDLSRWWRLTINYPIPFCDPEIPNCFFYPSVLNHLRTHVLRAAFLAGQLEQVTNPATANITHQHLELIVYFKNPCRSPFHKIPQPWSLKGSPSGFRKNELVHTAAYVSKVWSRAAAPCYSGKIPNGFPPNHIFLPFDFPCSHPCSE